MRGQEHIALAKQGFEAAVRGDYETLRSLLTRDVRFSGPFQPELHGIDEVIAEMKRSDQLGFTTGQHEYEGAWSDENRVVLLHHLTLRRDSRTVETRTVQVIEFRDGKASEITTYTYEPDKLSELMS